MLLSNAIERMQALLAKFGDVEVFFDCPWCLRSFPPNKVVTLAVHLTSQEEEKS